MIVLRSRLGVLSVALLAIFLWCCGGGQPAPVEPITTPESPRDPLPSWNDTAAKSQIIAFVNRVTDPSSSAFVEEQKRIATFDNDGTLWVEQPLYTELTFAVSRVKELAPTHPEWKRQEPFKSLLAGNTEGVVATGQRGLVEIVLASHTGMSTALFNTIVVDWLNQARHPRFGRPYTALAYQPQLELLAYLRENGFKTFIVSGGSVDFMRPWTERVYGIPPEQVVGSAVATRFEVQGGQPSLLRLPEVAFVDDKAGKPVGIHHFIGRQPILAFGNSDGDLEMLQWTTIGSGGARLGLLLHHDDAEREYAYDRDSMVGRLDEALDAAPTANWVVVSMKNDWTTVFPE
ncbi:MAG: haloacid dehalogenase-like hydrolase [Myxococcales bacterium]|nr:haloacid dehalogenase-like hydrolase [Myxococcales bacterium]MDH3844497.1 haloacid dehalogenase-like hydrolase [Myxococcales bacterium]